MENLNTKLTLSVEKAAQKLLNHFQAQYGSLIFLPLGVNAKTPEKIAPNIANNLEQVMLKKEENRINMLIADEQVEKVFDAFITGFFDSLNFIAKGIMKTLGMKMLWKDFAQELAENKTKNPSTYERWKGNLTMVLQEVFEQVAKDLKEAGESIYLSNGEETFEDVASAIHHLKIFQ